MIRLDRVHDLYAKYENQHMEISYSLNRLIHEAEHHEKFMPVLFDDFDEVFHELDQRITRILNTLIAKAQEATRKHPAATTATLDTAQKRVHHINSLWEEARELLNLAYKTLPKGSDYPAKQVSETRKHMRELTPIINRITNSYLEMADESERHHRLRAY